MPGLVEQLLVESDSDENLKLALSLAMSWHRKVAFYATSKVTNEHGDECDCIHLFGRESSSAREKGNFFKPIPRELHRIPFTVETPEALVAFIKTWLLAAVRTSQGGGDGTYSKGWRVEISDEDYDETCRITACWVYYGK